MTYDKTVSLLIAKFR